VADDRQQAAVDRIGGKAERDHARGPSRIVDE
jgi:hypothetical protein